MTMIRRCDGGEGAGGVGYLRLVAALSTLLFGMCMPLRAGAQCGGAWENISALPSLNYDVRAVLALPDGDFVVGGFFTSSGMIPAAPHVLRFHSATNTWSSMGAGVAANVYSLARLSNGRLVAGAVNSLWMYDPASDAWAAVGGAVNGTVYSVASLPDGDVLVGGSFVTVGGVPAAHVAVYSPSTDTWRALAGGVNGVVNAVLVRSNGDLVVGGNFDHVNGMVGRGVARFVPASGTWIPTSAGAHDLLSLAETPDGKILVGLQGYFNVSAGTIFGVALWSPESDSWAIVGGGLSGSIYHVSLDIHNDYVVGGLLGSAGPVSIRGMARFSVANQTWSALTSPSGSAPTIYGFDTQPNGDIVAGGNFTVINYGFAQNVGRFSHLTNTWMGPTCGVTLAVRCLAELPSGEIFAGGDFNSVGGMGANRVARFDPEFNIWRTMGAGMDGGVYAAAVTQNGDVVAGGAFQSAGGAPASRIAMYLHDAQVWIPLGAGVDGTVMALGVSPSRVVYAGGSFAHAGGTSATNLAAYDLDSQTWTSLGAIDGQVTSICVLRDGRLVVGGSFTRVDTLIVNHIAVYSPQTAEWEALGAGRPSTVLAMGQLANGDLAVSSTLPSLAGMSCYSFGTGTWRKLGATSPNAQTLTLLPSGDIITGTYASGTISYYSTVTDTWSQLVAPDPYNLTYAVLSTQDANLYVGGAFTTFAGLSSHNFARRMPGPPEILAQPMNVAACPGPAGATIAVGVISTSACTYQWRKDGSDIDTSVNPSAATATLVLNDVQETDAAMYHCVVTNACGIATSEPATLSVRAAGDPACAPACDPDVNQDGVADQGDVDYLINVIAGGENPNNANADFNNDGVADQGDVDALINVIAGGACP
ncbi:MAG: hypothetical protein GC200_11395 [Tepidisphaera sp.]|nr:hypothetical protein [Tepidisphaera sp.]